MKHAMLAGCVAVIAATGLPADAHGPEPDGLKHRPASTFGAFYDDFLCFKDPSFRRADLCSMVLHSPWR